LARLQDLPLLTELSPQVAGRDVTLFDISREMLDKSAAFAEKLLDRNVECDARPARAAAGAAAAGAAAAAAAAATERAVARVAAAVDPKSAWVNSKALVGIFSQTAGSTCEFLVSPVNFTFALPAGSASAEPRRCLLTTDNC
jgi:hypothetical protein